MKCEAGVNFENKLILLINGRSSVFATLMIHGAPPKGVLVNFVCNVIFQNRI